VFDPGEALLWGSHLNLLVNEGEPLVVEGRRTAGSPGGSSKARPVERVKVGRGICSKSKREGVGKAYISRDPTATPNITSAGASEDGGMEPEKPMKCRRWCAGEGDNSWGPNRRTGTATLKRNAREIRGKWG